VTFGMYARPAAGQCHPRIPHGAWPDWPSPGCLIRTGHVAPAALLRAGEVTRPYVCGTDLPPRFWDRKTRLCMVQLNVSSNAINASNFSSLKWVGYIGKACRRALNSGFSTELNGHEREDRKRVV